MKCYASLPAVGRYVVFYKGYVEFTLCNIKPLINPLHLNPKWKYAF
jgi:hypothetical protein